MGYVLTAFMGWLFAVRNYGARRMQQVAPSYQPAPRRPVYRTIYTEPLVPGQRTTSFGTFNSKTGEFKEGEYSINRKSLLRHTDGRVMSLYEFLLLPSAPRKTKRVIVGYLDPGAIPTPEDIVQYRLSALEAQEALAKDQEWPTYHM